MTRRFVIVAIGSAGDVHPFAAIADALKNRGHAVTFMANGHFEPLARRLGLPFVALGSDEDYRRAMLDSSVWHARDGFPTVWNYLLPSIETSYRWIEQHADRDTVLVGSTLALGTRVARDALNLPLVTAHLAPVVMLSADDPPRIGPRLFPEWMPAVLVRLMMRLGDAMVLDPLMAPEINRLRSAKGLEPVKRIMSDYIHSPDRVMLLFPDWFAPAARDWPAQSVHVGFPLFDESGLHALPDELRRFLDAGEAPLLFTPGSAMQHADRFFAHAAAACRALRKRGLFVTRYTDQLPALPPDSLRLDYVPFSDVLPHVQLAAYHGGIGTCAQTLAAGVPHLIVPNAHDQFDNGRRVERLGVGRMLAKTASASGFMRAIDELLNEAGVRERCRSWQAAMAAPSSVIERACRLIESTRRTP